MSYRLYSPDPGQTLADLARAVGGPIICHRRDLDKLHAAGISAELLAHGGPQPGEIWVVMP